MERIPGWKIVENGKWVSRKFTFKNFRRALAFTNEVGEFAEASMHHPDMRLGWGYCEIMLQTHDIGGISEKDIALAEQINGIEV
jgi:4a-hydroxytetrahydrobiopterin dehydratase